MASKKKAVPDAWDDDWVKAADVSRLNGARRKAAYSMDCELTINLDSGCGAEARIKANGIAKPGGKKATASGSE
jgi:hypothetical protein